MDPAATTRGAGITTVPVDAPGMSWLQDISERQHGIDSRMAVMAAPRLRNISAQILLHVADGQDFRETKCWHLARPGPDNLGLAALSQAFGSVNQPAAAGS